MKCKVISNVMLMPPSVNPPVRVNFGQRQQATRTPDTFAPAARPHPGIEHYLAMISYIGEKGANGYGQIAGLTIEPATMEEAENWMIRTLPAGRPGLPAGRVPLDHFSRQVNTFPMQHALATWRTSEPWWPE